MKKGISLSLWVFGYSLIYMFLTLLYCLPRVLAEYSSIDVSHIAEGFTFPLDIFAWGLLLICTAYAGIDRASLIKKSNQMDIGEYDIGNTNKLRAVILFLTCICVESYTFNFFLGHPITIYGPNGAQTFNGINLPLEGITTALVSAITIYVAGNKAIQGSEFTYKPGKPNGRNAKEKGEIEL